MLTAIAHLKQQNVEGNKCSFDRCKCQFFKELNAIFTKVGRFTSEEVVLNLIRAKCLPVLLYGVELCPVVVRDKKSMEFTVTRSLMKLFKTEGRCR